MHDRRPAASPRFVLPAHRGSLPIAHAVQPGGRPGVGGPLPSIVYADGVPTQPEQVQTLGEIGEFGLIDRVARDTPQGAAVLLGPGDDAAIIAAPDGRVVASTDLLLEGRHFRLDWSSAHEIGRKAAAQSLADIAAMGARPTALLVGLAAPAHLPVSWAVALAAGLAQECAQLGVSVAGGDTTRGPEVMLAVTALGDLAGRAPITRAGAHPGDKVAYAGELGWSACGLAYLSASPDHKRRLAAPEQALARHRVPRPPYSAGPQAAAAGATAMLDVSDGLLADLGHIAQESRVRIDLDPAAFPLPEEMRETARALGMEPMNWMLTGGEDHALVACFPAQAAIPAEWRVIGVVGAGAPTVTVAGQTWLGPLGWDHFR
jgi:thiamine-monophosphate kinase